MEIEIPAELAELLLIRAAEQEVSVEEIVERAIKNFMKRVLQTKVKPKNEKSPAKFARLKKGITKQAGEGLCHQPRWSCSLV